MTKLPRPQTHPVGHIPNQDSSHVVNLMNIPFSAQGVITSMQSTPSSAQTQASTTTVSSVTARPTPAQDSVQIQASGGYPLAPRGTYIPSPRQQIPYDGP